MQIKPILVLLVTNYTLWSSIKRLWFKFEKKGEKKDGIHTQCTKIMNYNIIHFSYCLRFLGMDSLPDKWVIHLKFPYCWLAQPSRWLQWTNMIASEMIQRCPKIPLYLKRLVAVLSHLFWMMTKNTIRWCDISILFH